VSAIIPLLLLGWEGSESSRSSATFRIARFIWITQTFTRRVDFRRPEAGDCTGLRRCRSNPKHAALRPQGDLSNIKLTT